MAGKGVQHKECGLQFVPVRTGRGETDFLLRVIIAPLPMVKFSG